MEKETPKSLGFMMPAEWEKHSAVWLAWPYDITTFTQGIEKAEKTFCEIIKALERSEKVELIVLNNEMQKRAEGLLADFKVDLSNVNFRQVEYADVWTRDYALLFLRKDVYTKWQYNAYGKANEDAVYWAPLLKDNDVFNKITLPGKKFEPGIVMEGGAIDVNGLGMCLTTEQTLMNPNRNPSKGKVDMEKYLADYLGIQKTIWLKEGLVNDHTDGHIDEIARFVGPNKIVCAYEENSEDENFKILDDNYQVLKNATDQNGKSFEVIK